MRGISQLGGAMRALNAPSAALSGSTMHANSQPLTGQLRLRPRPVARPRNSIVQPATGGRPPRRLAPRVPTERPLQVLGPHAKAAGRSPSAPPPLVWRVVNASCAKLSGLGFCHDERGLERRLHTRRVLERVQQMAVESGAAHRLHRQQQSDRDQSDLAMATVAGSGQQAHVGVIATANAADARPSTGHGRHTKLEKHGSSREESVYEMASDLTLTGGSSSGRRTDSDGSRLSERISSSPYELAMQADDHHRQESLAERLSSSPYELAECGRGPLLSGRISSANSSSSTDSTYEMACVQTALQFKADSRRLDSNTSFNFADATPEADDNDSSSDYDFGSITWLEQGLVASFENAMRMPDEDSDSDCDMVSGPLADFVVPTKPKKGKKAGSGKGKALLASLFRRRSRTKSAKSMASNV